MYAKGKGSTVPSDAQAREKLALYVYEYLLHVGAQKAAQTFLSEFNQFNTMGKNITLGEPPGFYTPGGAPERRETCEHSSEAKAFHDYGFFVNSGYAVNGIAHNPTAPSPLGQMPPNDGMPGGPMPPGFLSKFSYATFTTSTASFSTVPHPQPPPHSQMMQNQTYCSLPLVLAFFYVNFAFLFAPRNRTSHSASECDQKVLQKEKNLVRVLENKRDAFAELCRRKL
ncbi:single-stranded DNA-binding protein 3 [Caerostris extrusa]|uniref:Single-stranded DNA-binding protein 3 n=1 Tax=Caerostris extrusa TaxID=172846 RepID=A0AAV4N625_CAEEX|nr:single-stranded DNA-binding protein 3 [Caerostris extrusa]